ANQAAAFLGSHALRAAAGSLAAAAAARRARASSDHPRGGPRPDRPGATQLRIACAEGSNSRASCSGSRPARTSSIICRLNSGGYGARCLWGIVDPSPPNHGVSTKPGQLQGPSLVTGRVSGYGRGEARDTGSQVSELEAASTLGEP